MQSAAKTLILFSLFNLTSAHAEIYICKDASGHTLTSDRPIPECADRVMRQYGNNGVMRKEIPAPLTPEQKREKQAAEEKKKAEDAAADEQKRADRALTARFRNEDDIAQARARDLSLVGDQIVQQKRAVASAEQELQAAQVASAAQKQAGTPVYGSKMKLDRALQNVYETRATLQDTQNDLAHINAKYDQILKRYREIAAAVSAQ